MTPSPYINCRFAVVQYCHDPARGEALNVGVLLERQDDGSASAVFSDGSLPARLYRRGFDKNVYRSFVLSLSDQLSSMQSEQLSYLHPTVAPPIAEGETMLDYIHREYGGQYQISEPRPVLARDITSTLERLRHDLIDPAPEVQAIARERTEQRRMHRKLRLTFERHNLLGTHKVEENIKLQGHLFGPVTFDFGYRNGQATLFQGLWFGPLDRSKKLDRAGTIGLRVNDVRRETGDINAYVVIGQQRGPDAPTGIAEVQELLTDQGVQSVLADNFDSFVDQLLPTLFAGDPAFAGSSAM